MFQEALGVLYDPERAPQLLIWVTLTAVFPCGGKELKAQGQSLWYPSSWLVSNTKALVMYTDQVWRHMMLVHDLLGSTKTTPPSILEVYQEARWVGLSLHSIVQVYGPSLWLHYNFSPVQELLVKFWRHPGPVLSSSGQYALHFPSGRVNMSAYVSTVHPINSLE